MKTKINCVMKGLAHSTVTAAFVEKVLSRLQSLSYEPTKEDCWLIGFCVQKVEAAIKNSSNVNGIPEGLTFIAADMVCGEFLLGKKQSGGLEDSFDLDQALKTVQAGDTTVTFDNDSGVSLDQKMDGLIDHLLNGGKEELLCYRKLRW